jgi:hypothetical protein
MHNLILCLVAVSLGQVWAARPPFFKKIGADVHVIGNDVWNVTVNRVLANKLYFKGVELVGRGRGHFASYSKGYLKDTLNGV